MTNNEYAKRTMIDILTRLHNDPEALTTFLGLVTEKALPIIAMRSLFRNSPADDNQPLDRRCALLGNKIVAQAVTHMLDDDDFARLAKLDSLLRK